jgi:hypothetical protein
MTSSPTSTSRSRLSYLQNFDRDREIGSLSENDYSFIGYQGTFIQCLARYLWTRTHATSCRRTASISIVSVSARNLEGVAKHATGQNRSRVKQFRARREECVFGILGQLGVIGRGMAYRSHVPPLDHLTGFDGYPLRALHRDIVVHLDHRGDRGRRCRRTFYLDRHCSQSLTPKMNEQFVKMHRHIFRSASTLDSLLWTHNPHHAFPRSLAPRS